jgi:predicted small secreted protein
MNKLLQSKLLEIVNTMEFINEIPSPPMQIEFTCNGKKYNLYKSFNEMTAGQYADIDYHSHDKKGLDYVPYIMAITFFQEGEKTYSEAMPFIKERAKEFRQLPCTLIIGISNFFLLLRNLSRKDFQKFLTMSEAKMVRMLAEVESYSRNTDGQVSFISSQKMTYLNSMHSQIKEFARSYTS